MVWLCDGMVHFNRWAQGQNADSIVEMEALCVDTCLLQQLQIPQPYMITPVRRAHVALFNTDKRQKADGCAGALSTHALV
ncbi:hypothetical protein GCM10010082_08170 [Kushneria pakistanensis]|uniref:Uncharacterized protein n=1 Tax=Kushneria pakistanensis TaxID=1508770 RepID=A0ABQ3FD88_9GAMM|nr:hypothetical protein GCM10010082_08170 [Kushneria pakistanensis]